MVRVNIHQLGSGQPTRRPQPEPQPAANETSDELQAHPLADLFPRMESAEVCDLAEDIRQHGLREPITLYEGKILDGRNRYLACLMSAVKPRTVQFQGDADQAAAFVLSANLHRRHLTPFQRSELALKLEPIFAQAAKARRLANLKRGNDRPEGVKTTPSGKALAKAAKAAGASLGKTKLLKRAAKRDPNVIGLTKRDKLTARELAEAAGFEQRPRRGRPERTRTDDAPPVDPRQVALPHTAPESAPANDAEAFDVNAEAAKLDVAIVSLAKRWPDARAFVQHARAALDRYAETFAAD